MSGALAPIARHPLFPAAVALWFGALFGLSCLVMDPSVIEKAFAVTGIDKLFAFAAPPLGSTTRIQLALAMAGVGGILGSALARRFAQPKTAAHPRRRHAGAAELDAGEDIDPPLVEQTGGTELEGPAAQPVAAAPTGRRRNPLAPAPAEPKYPVYSYAVPGSTDDGGPLDDAEAREEASAQDEDVPAPDEEAQSPFELDTDAGEVIALETEDEEPQEAELPRLFSETSDAQRGVDAFEGPQSAQESGQAPRPHLFTRPHSAQVPTVGWGLEMAGSAPVALTTTEPEQDSGPDAEELDAPDVAPAIHAEPDEQADEDATVESAETEREAVSGGGKAERRIVAADLDELSHLELLERLAISIERKRRDAFAAPAARPETAEAEPIAFETNLPPLPPVPAALRPVNLDPDDDDEGSAGFAPPRHIAMQQAPSASGPTSLGDPGSSDDDMDTGEKAEQEYSSLIGLNRPGPAPTALSGNTGHGFPNRNLASQDRANQADSSDQAGLLRSNLAALRKMAGGE